MRNIMLTIFVIGLGCSTHVPSELLVRSNRGVLCRITVKTRLPPSHEVQSGGDYGYARWVEETEPVWTFVCPLADLPDALKEKP